MTEKVTKQYFCDFCGEEIDPKSPDGIHVFAHTHSKEGIVVRPLKQPLESHKEIAVVVENGDFCNVDHFACYIKRLISDRCKSKGVRLFDNPSQ
jgi:hypothetical protein